MGGSVHHSDIPSPEAPPTPPAPVTSIRGYIPQYLNNELTVKAAEPNGV